MQPHRTEVSQSQRWETQQRATSTMIRMLEVKRLLGHGSHRSKRGRVFVCLTTLIACTRGPLGPLLTIRLCNVSLNHSVPVDVDQIYDIA